MSIQRTWIQTLCYLVYKEFISFLWFCTTQFFSEDLGKQLRMNIEKGPAVISVSVGRKTWLIKRVGGGTSGWAHCPGII